MENKLLSNLDKLHTTALGIERIKKNLSLDTVDVVAWCKLKIENADSIVRSGKNWYVYVEDNILTINAHSFTIITAHKKKTVMRSLKRVLAVGIVISMTVMFGHTAPETHAAQETQESREDWLSDGDFNFSKRY